MNIFSYRRVSGLGQVDTVEIRDGKRVTVPKDGPIRQAEAINDFCRKHNLTLIQDFFEEGVTGELEAMDRPKFGEMIAKADILRAAAPMMVEAIVVERMDRLARDLIVSEFLLRECRNRGIKIFCADQGELIDMASNEGDPTRVMLRQILGAIAQWDKSVTVKKLRAARARVRAGGQRCEGKKPYGYTGEEKAVLHQIQICRDMDVSWKSISEILNKAGYTTRHGKQWDAANTYSVFSRRRCKRKEKS